MKPLLQQAGRHLGRVQCMRMLVAALAVLLPLAGPSLSPVCDARSEDRWWLNLCMVENAIYQARRKYRHTDSAIHHSMPCLPPLARGPSDQGYYGEKVE